jgi:CheY-like chemotaxis protein
MIVNHGEELMDFLERTQYLPDVLFLDLNMPRKNGFECLAEIKQSNKLKLLPVIVISTSSEPSIVDMAYEKGARYYIRKPNEYAELVRVIRDAIIAITKLPSADFQGKPSQPPIQEFILSSEPHLR